MLTFILFGLSHLVPLLGHAALVLLRAPAPISSRGYLKRSLPGPPAELTVTPRAVLRNEVVILSIARVGGALSNSTLEVDLSARLNPDLTEMRGKPGPHSASSRAGLANGIPAAPTMPAHDRPRSPPR